MGAGVLAPGVELVRLGQFAQRSGIYLVLIALLLVPALWLPEYRNVLNLGQIVQQSAALAILAIGQTFVIACRMIDLSVGQLMGLIVVASCSLMEGRPEATIPAILLALAIGLAVGAINGFLNNRLRIHSLILTLGMLSILQGVIFVYTDRSVGAASPAVLRIGNGTVMGVPVTVPLVLVVAALAALLLHRTRFGLHVRVVGANEEGARRAGIDVARVKLPVFILSGVSAAIAGIILAGRLGTGYPNAGTGFELDAIVAVVLGGTPLSGGRGTILGTLAAVLVLGVTANLLNLLGMSAFIQMVVKGAIVIAAVLINQPRALAAGMTALAPSLRRHAVRVLQRHGIWLVLLLLLLVSATLSDAFLRPAYLMNLVLQQTPVGITAIGVTLVMIAGGIDLSVGAIISLTAVMCAILMNGESENLPRALILTCLAGTLVGAFNGLLIAYNRVSPFILTLGTAIIVYGLTQIYSGGTASGVVSPGLSRDAEPPHRRHRADDGRDPAAGRGVRHLDPAAHALRPRPLSHRHQSGGGAARRAQSAAGDADRLFAVGPVRGARRASRCSRARVSPAHIPDAARSSTFSPPQCSAARRSKAAMAASAAPSAACSSSAWRSIWSIWSV